MIAKLALPWVGSSMEEQEKIMTVNVRVVLKKDEPIERALKRFKGLCERAGIKKILKDKAHFEKPSDVKRGKRRKFLRDLSRKNMPSRDNGKTKWKKPPVRFLPPQVNTTSIGTSSEAKPHEVTPTIPAELAKA